MRSERFCDFIGPDKLSLSTQIGLDIVLNLGLIDEKRVFDPSPEVQRSFILRATAGLRTLPDLFIAGAQKAGTSSLFDTLLGHPQILGTKFKEHYFFQNPDHFALGMGHYKTGFGTRWYSNKEYQKCRKKVHSIDATANYFEFPASAERIRSVIPAAKVIILLRDPVQRAWSHYRMAVRNGFEKADFPTALLQEEERIGWGASKGNHNYAFQRLAYRTKGIYADFLPAWLKVFKEDQLLVLQSERLFSEPEVILPIVLKFFELDSFPIRLSHVNADPDPVFPDPETEENLRKFYYIHNERLYKLLGQRYDWK